MSVPSRVVSLAPSERDRASCPHGTTIGHDLRRFGRRVGVRGGSWRGMEGMGEEHGRGDRLVLQIEMLGQATSQEIDACLHEPVDVQAATRPRP